MPDGERASTRSEPRRTFTLWVHKRSLRPTYVGRVPPASGYERVEVQEVVEPDHDERAEGRPKQGESLGQWGFEEGIRAVVEALRAPNAPVSRTGTDGGDAWDAAAEFVAERFNLTASGGDDDDG